MSAGDASVLRTGRKTWVEMKRFAVRMGISPEAILTRKPARADHENAVEIKRLLNDQSILLLVTSASHMPRAMAHFSDAGAPRDAGAVWIRPGRSLRPFLARQPVPILSHERMRC